MQQLAWQKMELLLFVHFGINTFTGNEWGDGTEDPALFNPTDFDPEQWVRVAEETGFEGLILTAKHHEGFALWPTAHSDFSIERSPWKDGRGDIIAEVAEATHNAGLAFGVYLSPWDRHEPSYGTSSYNDFYVNQLTELLTNYGPIFEVWMDGAHGEGVTPNYDYARFFATIRDLQPEALMAIAGPDIRWIGNERAEADETQWSVVDGRWYPSECDVSIRPGWFWHAHEDPHVRSVDNLIDLNFLRPSGATARCCSMCRRTRPGAFPSPT
jgi:alpha-L-fucosidase